MEMFLMIACMSLFALGIMAAAFGAATRSEEPASQPKPVQEPIVVLPPAQFFADYTVSPKVTETEVPIEVLLLQIENHIRLEQAAAQSFLAAPSPTVLHSKTVSPLVQ